MLAAPAYLLLLAAIVVATAAACGGQLLVHRMLRNAGAVQHNDVAGFIIAVVGTLYAVVLGFITVTVWEQYQTTRERVALETSSVGDAWHDAVGLSQPARGALRRDMLAYANVMIKEEWPMMRRGDFSYNGDVIIMDATTIVGQVIPKNVAEANSQSAIIRLLNELHDARLSRLDNNHPSVSGFQWTVLLIGAIVVVGFCYLFGVERRSVHLIMTGAVAVLIASMFVLVFELQSPFRTDLGITSESWTALLAHIQDMDSQTGPMNMQQ